MEPTSYTCSHILEANLKEPFSNISFVGYSSLKPEEILRRVVQGEDVTNFSGDFVVTGEIAREKGSKIVIASSALAAIPYFYGLSSNGERLVHASNVFECVCKSGLGWEWNDRAVMCLALFQHTLQDDTLHPKIHRIPHSSVFTFEAGKLSVRSFDPWRKRQDDTDTFDVHKAVRVVNEITGEIIQNRNVLISLSAGFDSRVLLSSVLANGRKPLVATMGSNDATDVRIAAAIAREFELEHRIVSLDPADYLKHATDIVRLTSGTKTADHWHTHLFGLGLSLDDNTVHVAGSNGELVRSYYFDKGMLASGSQWAPKILADVMMRLKNGSRRRLPFGVAGGILADRRLASGALDLMSRSLPDTRGWLNSLDRFYSVQRVRHFIGNGLALFNSAIPTVSPFLDQRFIARAQAMPRRLKLNSRFHRRVILQNVPKLLEFPTDETNTPMRLSNKPGYWLGSKPVTSYSVFGRLADSGDAKSIVVDSPHLDRFLDRRSRETIAEKKQRNLSGLLLTLHFASELTARQNSRDSSLRTGTGESGAAVI